MRHDHDSDLVFSDDLPDEELDKLLAEMTETVFSDDLPEEELEKLLAEMTDDDKPKSAKESEKTELSLSSDDDNPTMQLVLDNESYHQQDKKNEQISVDRANGLELTLADDNELVIDKQKSDIEKTDEKSVATEISINQGLTFALDDDKTETTAEIPEKEETISVKNADEGLELTLDDDKPANEVTYDENDESWSESQAVSELVDKDVVKTETSSNDNQTEVEQDTKNQQDIIIPVLRKTTLSSTINIEEIKKLSEASKAKKMLSTQEVTNKIDDKPVEKPLSNEVIEPTNVQSEAHLTLSVDAPVKDDTALVKPKAGVNSKKMTETKTNPPIEPPAISMISGGTLPKSNTSQGNFVMNDDSIQNVKQQISTLQSQLHELSGQFFLANETSAKLISQVRELQLDDKTSYQATYEQAHELRTKIITSRKQFMELTSLLDLVEEALAGDVYNKQTKS